MKINRFLIIDRRGQLVIRKTLPRLSNEIAINLNIDIPNSIFQRPVIKTNMKVPAETQPGVTISTNLQVK